MAQLDEQAPVAADEPAAGAQTEDQPQDKEQLDGSDFYEDDQPNPEAEAGTDEGGEVDLDPIVPPNSWKEEEKTVFAGLPREAQETIARRETERDSYLRGQAAKHEGERQKLLTQARTELAEIHTRKAQEYQQIAAQFMPQPPDPRLLYTGNAEDQLAYQRQDASFRQASVHQQELLDRAQSEQEEAKRVAQAHEQEAAAADIKVLHEKFPDWFDDSRNLKGEVITRLQPIGEALGYPTELMAQANSTDFAALNTAAAWKAKADKWDALQKKRMAGVRDAKKLAPLAKPGAARGAQPNDDVIALLYPNDVRRQ